jgi:hypothetical protein
MGVYAFASRDNSNKIYINVMWVPGPFAASAPSIPITFVTDGGQGGVTVQAKPVETVALGSGRSFAIQCGTLCDAGFNVAFNATLLSESGKVLSSFTNSVEVPAVKAPPEAISLVGRWEGASHGKEVGFVMDDQKHVEGSSDAGGYFHKLVGTYSNANTINMTIERKDPAGCVTSVSGYIKVIGRNSIEVFQEGWNGCGVRTDSVVSVLTRLAK